MKLALSIINVTKVLQFLSAECDESRRVIWIPAPTFTEQEPVQQEKLP